ncbi:hypothetical protein DRH14_01260 [Candidatus Shapirobacteria bacterium]|nr:MAG: hypothetical protein DRH14_01260 [Candidatus Shapirobacteria bacterium]
MKDKPTSQNIDQPQNNPLYIPPTNIPNPNQPPITKENFISKIPTKIKIVFISISSIIILLLLAILTKNTVKHSFTKNNQSPQITTTPSKNTTQPQNSPTPQNSDNPIPPQWQNKFDEIHQLIENNQEFLPPKIDEQIGL